jgi:hypothetical protein
MNFYTIATKSSECYGHGDYGEELSVRQEGSHRDYRFNKFPPLFKSFESAQGYLEGLDFRHRKMVVTLSVKE